MGLIDGKVAIVTGAGRGIGRAVAIAVPVLMGYLFQAGWAPSSAYQAFGFVVLAAGLLIYGLHLT